MEANVRGPNGRWWGTRALSISTKWEVLNKNKLYVGPQLDNGLWTTEEQFVMASTNKLSLVCLSASLESIRAVAEAQ